MSEAIERVREQIQATLTRLGAEGTDTQETILIRDGFYCGRRFERDGLEAIWFVEENEIKYYGRDGGVVFVAPPSVNKDKNVA